MTIQPAGTELAYVVTYLEMTERPSYGWPSAPAGPPLVLLHSENPPLWWFRALYEAVGRDYAWEDVPAMDDAALGAWLDPKHMHLHVLMAKGWPHGFFLLHEQDPETTDLAYFGLVPEAVGRGLGMYLLRLSILTAWQREGLRRLTVNTCTLDHPRALRNYQRAGFSAVHREERTRKLTRARDLSRIPD